MNNLLEHRGFYGTVEFSAADNILFGKALGINGLISYEGKSIEELKNDFILAIDDYLELCEEQGIAPEKIYKGKFNVRVSPELHKALVVYSASHGQTLNYTVEEALKKYVI
ncbi:MAG: type II toxin-antitoxin system HicB family antitoxin [Lachnospiraceae bacterium]|nr:type II toxin-antitoxin system HicB family antitoxin [Lachnospiraceae bacterium]